MHPDPEAKASVAAILVCVLIVGGSITALATGHPAWLIAVAIGWIIGPIEPDEFTHRSTEPNATK